MRKVPGPKRAMLHVTHRCDLACLHCFQTAETHPHEEMSRAQISDVLRQLAEAGVLFLTITGGEPFLRRDLLDIIAEARKLRFAVILKTAGQHLSVDKVAQLKKLGVHEVQVSLYSHQHDQADAFTQRRGSWERAVTGLMNLQKAGVHSNVRAAMTTFNYQHLKELTALAHGLGATVMFGSSVDVRTSGDRSTLELALNPAQRAVGMAAAGGTAKVEQQAEDLCSGDSFKNADNRMCLAATGVVSISATGEVHPCMLHPQSAGNVLQNGFDGIWQDSPLLNDIRGVTYGEMAKTGCSGCGYQRTCHPCMALAAVEHGQSRDCNTSSYLDAQAKLLLARSQLPEPPGGWPEPTPPPRMRGGRGMLRVIS